MANILIADSSKASLVMSSEVFKDKLTGSNILVAETGKRCLEILSSRKVDMCVIDFDLPDVDGITLIQQIRPSFQGPILMTAYPDPVVVEAVQQELFAFQDAGEWVRKPVKAKDLARKIDDYLIKKYRLNRRIEVAMKATLQLTSEGASKSSKASGSKSLKSNKKAEKLPKITAHMVNMSLSGVRVRLDTPSPSTFKAGEEITLALALAASSPKSSQKTTKKSENKTASKASSPKDAKLKVTVAWCDEDQNLGLSFSKMSDSQKKVIESMLKDHAF